MKLLTMLQTALESTDAVGELRRLATERLATGTDKAAVLEAFEQLRRELRAANRERDEDAVMDAMDFLSGWCSPHMKLPAKGS